MIDAVGRGRERLDEVKQMVPELLMVEDPGRVDGLASKTVKRAQALVHCRRTLTRPRCDIDGFRRRQEQPETQAFPEQVT